MFIRLQQMSNRTTWRSQSKATESTRDWQLTCCRCESTAQFWGDCPHKCNEKSDQCSGNNRWLAGRDNWCPRTTSRSWWEEGTASISAPTPLLDTWSLSQERWQYLNVQSWIGEKTCLITNTRATMTTARPDTAMGLNKGSLVNVTFCTHCWRRPSDSTTLEDAPSSKAGRSGQEARGHTTTWGY
jgi:hypothetical protein